MYLAKSRAVFLFTILLVLTACSKGPLTPETVINAPEGVGIKGYDAVAYHTDRKAVRGDTRFQTTVDGVTYQFASADNQSAFEASPEKYLPAYGGYCAYAMSNGDIVDINPKNWSVVDDKLYLNANIFAEALFSLDKQGRIKKADKHWMEKTGAIAVTPPVNTNP